MYLSHYGGVLIQRLKESYVCRVALICVTCDLPAKAAVMNMVQFNGYWGCGQCLQKGMRNHYACILHRILILTPINST